jgi:glycosyltransferase involved in cell wall biosynthesis
MKLAIDASRSVDRIQKTGVEVVSDALLKELEASCPSDVAITYYTPELISWLPREKQRILSFKRFWTVIHLSYALWKDRPDALFVPVHNIPLWLPKRVVRIIHDISSFRAPQTYALKERWLIARDARRSQKVCKKVFVPTEAVKQDLIQLAGFAPEQVIVTGWALDTSTIPVESSTRSSQNKPYLLFVGRIEDKKNVRVLIEAFRLFKIEHPEWKLILAGKPGYGFEAIESLLKEPGVTHLGYVTNEEKWQLLRGAAAMVIPSKEEGFSFPMLEAFQAGIPVVASDIPPLHDVGGEACVFVSPVDPGSVARGLASVVADNALAERLVTLGKERLKLFSWQRIAKQVWDSILL